MGVESHLGYSYDQTAAERNYLEDSVRAGKITASEYEACETTVRWSWRSMLAGAGISIILGPIAVNRFLVHRATGQRVAGVLASIVVGGGTGMIIGALAAKQKFRDVTSSGNVNQIWDAYEEIKSKSKNRVPRQ